jgi:hypothetical protein
MAEAEESLRKHFLDNYGSSVFNYSRSGIKDKGTYAKDNNYVKSADEKFPSPTSLAEEAVEINAAESNAGKKSGTTIFCVALMDRYHYVKKFAFCNSDNKPMPPDMRKKAVELGYDVIKADQSHAEGQFVQFLCDRECRHKGLYTHIVGMGCDRQHCDQCDCLLRLVLGTDYYAVTAVNTAPIGHKPVMLAGEGIGDPGELINIGSQSTFFIPTILEMVIRNMAGLSGATIDWGTKYKDAYAPDPKKRRRRGKNPTTESSPSSSSSSSSSSSTEVKAMSSSSSSPALPKEEKPISSPEPEPKKTKPGKEKKG